MNLVIVESPTKAKTISHFLGPNFKVVASYGHVRDLPKSKLGIDTEHQFTPTYIIPKKAQKHVTELKKLAQKADEIILATDEDREGEAIAWHLTEVLAPAQKTLRIAFHEITETAIKEALAQPRELNMNLVNAQQARRILDRLVGYELSPFLWKKLFRGLSAGRVQSPALRLVVEREQERQNFQSEKYFTLSAFVTSLKDKTQSFEAELTKINQQPLPSPGLKEQVEVEKIKNELKDAIGFISQIKKGQQKMNPLPPFTTSTLQQAAWQKYHFPAKKTMFLAQALYEGKDLGKGPLGLITYMRTDSLNLAPQALKDAQEFLQKKYGDKYTLPKPRLFKAKSRLAQEAHEAIRPTQPQLEPSSIKQYLSADEFKLYQLIWSRFMASQMPEALIEKQSLTLEVQGDTNRYSFQANFRHLIFDGFLKIYPDQKLVQEDSSFPLFELQDQVLFKELQIKEHTTQPPPRYNDATLVKTLEAFGIGRPSTYAPIISVLQERGYLIRDENKYFKPTEIGVLVNDILVKHFFEIVDYQFTSQIEEKLDEVAQGKLNWQAAVAAFYFPFKKNLDQKYGEVSKEEVSPVTTLNETCPLCGKPLVTRWGKYGKFISCSDWPNCKFTKSLQTPETLNLKCPKCQKGEVVIKRNKKGRSFYACSRWPDCDFTSSLKPSGTNCPQCGSFLVETKTKVKCSNKNCDYELPKESDN